MRKVGKNESHVKLIDVTLRQTWRSFRDLEKRFLVRNPGGAAEGAWKQGSDVEDAVSGDSESQFEDEKGRYSDEKGYGGGRVRDRRGMRRRDSHIRGKMMGMWDAGLSIDRTTYYNTDLKHRFLWWWRRDDVNGLSNRVWRLQIRRIQRDMLETDCLVKRGLAILGGMSGENPYLDCGEGKGPQGGGGGSGGTRKRHSYKGARSNRGVASMNGQRSRNQSRSGVREVYEKEIRRVRKRSDSASSSSSRPTPPSPRAKVAGSTVSMQSRGNEPRRRSSRAPSVEYEVVNPGRIWVDVERPGSDRTARASSGDVDRPPAAHFTSYLRERPSMGRMRDDRRS